MKTEGKGTYMQTLLVRRKVIVLNHITMIELIPISVAPRIHSLLELSIKTVKGEILRLRGNKEIQPFLDQLQNMDGWMAAAEHLKREYDRG